jgi:hypothetical protein
MVWEEAVEVHIDMVAENVRVCFEVRFMLIHLVARGTGLEGYGQFAYIWRPEPIIYAVVVKNMQTCEYSAEIPVLYFEQADPTAIKIRRKLYLLGILARSGMNMNCSLTFENLWRGNFLRSSPLNSQLPRLHFVTFRVCMYYDFSSSVSCLLPEGG